MDLLIPYPQSSNQTVLIHLHLNQPNIIINLLQTKVSQVMDLKMFQVKPLQQKMFITTKNIIVITSKSLQ